MQLCWSPLNTDSHVLLVTSLSAELQEIHRSRLKFELLPYLIAAEAAAKILDERSDKSKQVYFYDEDEGQKLMPALREGLTAPIGTCSNSCTFISSVSIFSNLISSALHML